MSGIRYTTPVESGHSSDGWTKVKQTAARIVILSDDGYPYSVVPSALGGAAAAFLGTLSPHSRPALLRSAKVAVSNTSPDDRARIWWGWVGDFKSWWGCVSEDSAVGICTKAEFLQLLADFERKQGLVDSLRINTDIIPAVLPHEAEPTPPLTPATPRTPKLPPELKALARPEFYDAMRTLTEINYVKDWLPSTRGELTASEEKHLQLVNGIAMILVSGEKPGDVAAASFYMTNDRLRIIFAKNEPCTDADLLYIRTLTSAVRKLADEAAKLTPERRICSIGERKELDGRATTDLLNIVFRHCGHKIVARGLKIGKLIREASTGGTFEPWFCDTDGAFTKAVKDQSSLKWLPDQGIDEFLEATAAFDPNASIANATLSAYIRPLVVAHWIMKVGGVENVIRNSQVRRAIGKFGDYYAVCTRLVQLSRDPAYTHRLRSLETKEASKKPITQSLYKNPLQSLTDLARFLKLDEETVRYLPEMIKETFSPVRAKIASNPGHAKTYEPKTPDRKQYIIKVHCEIAVALELLSQSRGCYLNPTHDHTSVDSVVSKTKQSAAGAEIAVEKSGSMGLSEQNVDAMRTISTFEIGVSKSTCYACEQWFKFFEQQARPSDARFLLHSFHGKLYEGWGLPGHDPTDAMVVSHMNAELEKALYRAIRNRRSESPENDIKHLNEEEMRQTSGAKERGELEEDWLETLLRRQGL